MPDELWFEKVEDALVRKGLVHYSAPLKADADTVATIQARLFGPYQDEDSNWQFSRGFEFVVPTGSDARWLYAMTTGSINYDPFYPGPSGAVILTSLDVAGLALMHTVGGLPDWYPPPRYIIYNNVDPEDAKQAALQALTREGATEIALKQLKKAKGDSSINANAVTLAELWLNGELPQGLPVLGGDLVGSCGMSPFDPTSDTLFAEVQIVQELDPTPTLFYNPSYYLALWDSLEWVPLGDALLEKLVDTSGPPSGTGGMLFVKAHDSSNTAPYASPATASHSIRDAVAVASNGDTVLILDQETYSGKVIIEKPISITSISTKNAIQDDNPDYPIIDGLMDVEDPEGDPIRPITIRNITNGIAHVGKLIITNGRATLSGYPDDPDSFVGRGDGGGILVENTNNVVISSCVIRDCIARYPHPPIARFAVGFGGGISTYHASPAIIGCTIKNNKATDRGKGIGVYGYGWPAIFDCKIFGNESLDFGRHDGGGIGIQIAVPNTEDIIELITTPREDLYSLFNSHDLARSQVNFVRIVRCEIRHNLATDDGGGVYATVASRLIMRSTKVDSNQAYDNGGGIRVTFGSILYLIDCEISQNECNIGLEKYGGGGISARNAPRVQLKNTIVKDNFAKGFAGGGLYFISTDAGPAYGEVGEETSRDFDFNDFFSLNIYRFDQALLRIDSTSDFFDNVATKEPEQILNHGKGGGVYILRWKGNRKSGLGPMEGRPIGVFLADPDVLKPTNSASFPDSDRIYIDDQVAVMKKDDTDLPEHGPYIYTST